MSTITNLVSVLPTLNLSRCTLEESEPAATFLVGPSQEVLVYPLIGAARVSCGGVSSGILDAGRGSVLGRLNRVLRWKPQRFTNLVLSLAYDRAADFLIIFNGQPVPPQSQTEAQNFRDGPIGDILVQDFGVHYHTVGKGTHERTVTEFETPEGFLINTGETLNVPGGWSSWPAHASPEDAEKKCRDHAEIFFVITPGKGYLFMDGWFSDGSRAFGMVEAENGKALVTPLGSHPIVFTPGDWGWYWWGYVSTAITKTYNKWAHECGLKTYVE